MPERKRSDRARLPSAGAGESRATTQLNKVSPARWSAFQVLQQMEEASSHSDDLLHGPLLRGLSQTDRNLATALVLGVLRWQIPLDAELGSLLDRPDQPLPVPVRLALRMGAFQLRHMDRIPPHAALSESVELVRAAGQPKTAGLVNAVLRRLLTKTKPGRPIVESIEAAAQRLGHPAWLVRRWEASYGRAAALAICEYDQHQPERGDLFEQRAVSDELAQEIDGATEAAADLLDDGSRLVAELAAISHADPRRIWDTCAAPGGKTLVLARRHPDAELLATDISPRRLAAMRTRLELALPDRPLRTLQSDAAKLPHDAGLFDLILCDVPCSGTGTLSRNPEIRHRLEPADLGRQARRQHEILNAALPRLAPGGRLVYSTCSLEPEENERLIESVLSSNPGYQVIAAAGLLQALRDRHIVHCDKEALQPLIRADMLRTLPGANFRGDGFFAVVLTRGG